MYVCTYVLLLLLSYYYYVLYVLYMLYYLYINDWNILMQLKSN